MSMSDQPPLSCLCRINRLRRVYVGPTASVMSMNSMKCVESVIASTVNYDILLYPAAADDEAAPAADDEAAPASDARSPSGLAAAWLEASGNKWPAATHCNNNSIHASVQSDVAEQHVCRKQVIEKEGGHHDTMVLRRPHGVASPGM